jgi:hypothetical protein
MAKIGGVKMVKMLSYCDKCGQSHGLPIQSEGEKIVKGECAICHMFMGALNETSQEANEELKSMDFGSFKVERLPNFLPGLSPSKIHQFHTYQVQTPESVIYYPTINDGNGLKSIIIANPKKGHQIQIFWNEKIIKNPPVARIDLNGSPEK